MTRRALTSTSLTAFALTVGLAFGLAWPTTASAYPLDMSQYDLLFQSTRIPRLDCDDLQPFDADSFAEALAGD